MRIKSAAGVLSILLVLSVKSPGAGQTGVKRDDWTQEIQHALNLESTGDFAGAERTLITFVHEAEKPTSDPHWLPTALDRLGLLNWDLGRTRQAEEFYIRAAELWRTRFGPSNLGLATSLSNLAWADVGLGDSSGAESLWRQSLEIRIAILGHSDAAVAQIYGYMAINAFSAQRPGEAESFCQQALRIYARTGKIAGETDEVLSSLASVRVRQGRNSEAIELMTEAIQIQQTATHPSVRVLAGHFYNLALAEDAAGRQSDAEAHFEKALSMLAAPPYATQTLRYSVLSSYAQFLSRAGHKRVAKTVQRQASALAQVIRRQSYTEYVADVSTLR